MANNVFSNIMVNVNNETEEYLLQKLAKVKESLWSYFIEEKDWTPELQSEMIGPKWAIIDQIDVNSLSITSAWGPPMEFCQNLYSELKEIDPLVEIVMTYEDEFPNYIGAYIINEDGEFNRDLEYDEIVELVKVEFDEINENENWDEEDNFSEKGLDLFHDVMWDIIANWQYEYIAKHEMVYPHLKTA
jgi:hypothetical protein